MKKLFTLLFSLMLLCLLAAPAFAITVDGDLSDWGLSALSGSGSDWSQDATWLPKTGVMLMIEDNNNPLHVGLPGFQAKGVHIIGSATNYAFYNEPTLKLKSNGMTVTGPWGGEMFDLEALYVTNDPSNVYVAIITSVPQGGHPPFGHDQQPGDLGLNFGAVAGESPFGYEYGVKLGTSNPIGNYQPGTIVYLPDWQSKGYVVPAIADVMKSPNLPGGGIVGQAQIAYTNSWLQHTDRGADNYVIELAIPKQALGLTANAGLSNLHTAQNCANDNVFIPEFPTIAVSLGAILGFVFVIFLVKSKNQ